MHISSVSAPYILPLSLCFLLALCQAYLRPKSSLETVLGAAAARPYFGPGPQGESNPRGAPCGTEDLLPLTPYLRYRNFYRCPEVAGNSYLWDQREAEAQVSVHFLFVGVWGVKGAAGGS